MPPLERYIQDGHHCGNLSSLAETGLALMANSAIIFIDDNAIENLYIYIFDMSLKIINWTLQPHPPEANNLNNLDTHIIIWWWCHDMETLSTLLVFVRESIIHRWMFHTKWPVMQSFDTFLLLFIWTNCSTKSWFVIDLRCLDAHVISHGNG